MIGSLMKEAGSISRLRRAWWILALIHLTVLLDFGLYLAERGGRPSRGLLALGAVLTLIAVGVAVVAVLLTDARLERLRGWIRPVQWVLAPICLLGLFGFGLGMRAELVYAHAAFVLALTTGLALITFALSNAPMRRSLLVGAIIVAVLAANFLRIHALSVNPPVNIIDEGWDLSWAVSALKTGITTDFTVVGGPGDPTYATTYWIPRWAIMEGQWLGLVGVGLWQGRLLNFFFALLTVAATARAARNLYGGHAGLFAGVALFTSAILLIGFRLRHDMALGLSIALSIWLYSEALKRDRAWLHLLAGLVMGWGGFAHYHAFGFGPVLLIALYLPRVVAGWRAGRWMPERGAWLYALGLIGGLGMVVVVQVLPDVTSFVVNRAPRNPETLSRFVSDGLGLLGRIVKNSWYQALLIGFGLLALLWRRRGFDPSLVLLLVLGQAMLPVITNLTSEHYLVPMTPIYALVAGTLVSETLVGRRQKSAVALVAGLCILMPPFGQTLKTPLRYWLTRQPVMTPAPPAARWVLDHVPPSETVMTENIYYLWLYDYGFISPNALDRVSDAGKLAQYGSRADFWLSLHPDVIIFDPDNNTYGIFQVLRDDPAYLPAHGYQRVAEFPGGRGPIQIYARDGVVTP